MVSRFQLLGSYDEVACEAWNGLLDQSGFPTPLMRHEFLRSLEQSSSIGADAGWQPIPLIALNDQQTIIGATPLFIKSHSYGEYVFDWAWADAYERAGLQYFPKLLVASPFSPIPGSRLLARDSDTKEALLSAIEGQVDELDLSSAHLLFPDENDLAALKSRGWLIRENVQFHWRNHGFQSFEDYLCGLTQPKRKKIRAERRKVRDAGVMTRVLHAEEITEDDLRFFYRCYERTYLEHRSTPYLSLAFFQQYFDQSPTSNVLVVAERDGQPMASSWLLCSDGVLYGRYWGALERVDCLHFEVAYYTPIEWAIEKGIQRFEGGAQGEHKLARGFEPVKTYSGHWLREPRFYDAVARFLERESSGIEAYVNELEARNPVRS